MRENASLRDNSPDMIQISAARGNKKLDETYASRAATIIPSQQEQ